MSERTVTARFRADGSQYIAEQARMGAATKASVATQTAALGQAQAASGRYVDAAGKMGAANDRFVVSGQQVGETFRQGAASVDGAAKSYAGYSTAAGAAGIVTAGLVVGLGAATVKFAQFDQAMSFVASSGADAAANIDALRAASLEAGAASVFTATESANAVENLAKAGLSAADILGGGLSASLDLAAAGSFAVAEAASITAGALTQFGLKGTEAVHVSDLLATGATKAQGDVRDLGLALQYVGTPLAALGVSVEETTGVLALFADNMIIGERAGTTLRSMISSLTGPTDRARTLMTELGISVFDAQGEFIGLEGVAGQLNGALGDATDAQRQLALTTIFGNEALQGANVLVKAGAEGVKAWTAEVNDGTTAASIASTRLDNLSGDFEKLQGAIDSALIQGGAAGNDVLRTMTQSATALVEAIGGLPTPVLGVGIALAALGVAVGLAATAYFIGAPKIAAFTTAVSTQTVVNGVATASMGRLAAATLLVVRALPAIAVVTTIAAVAVGAFAKSQADARARAEEFGATLDAQTGQITANTTAWARNAVVQNEDAVKGAELLGISTEVLTQAYLGQENALRTVNAAMDRARSGQTKFVGGSVQAASAVNAVNDLLDQGADAVAKYGEENDLAGAAARRHAAEQRNAKEEIEGVGAAFGDSAKASSDAADEQVENAGEVKAALEAEREEVEGLIDAYNTLRGITLGVGDAQADYQQSLDDTTEGIADLLEEQGKVPEGFDTAGLSIKDLIGQLGNLEGVFDGTADVFDETTQAGRDVREMFRGTADDAVDLAESIHAASIEAGEGVPEANRKMQESLAASRAAMSLTLQDLGVGKEAADALAESYIGVPDLVTTKMAAEDKEALETEARQEEALDRFEQARTVQLFGDDVQVLHVEDDQEGRLGLFERPRTVHLGADDTEADRVEADQEGRLGLFQQMRTVPLNADPARAIAGAASAQAAIDRIHGTTVYVDIRQRAFGGALEGLGYSAYGGRIGGTSPHDRADDKLYALTSGEAVIGAPEVRHIDQIMGRGFLDQLIQGGIPTGIGSRSLGGGQPQPAIQQATASPSREPTGSGLGSGTYNFYGYPRAKASDDITRAARERALIDATLPTRR